MQAPTSSNRSTPAQFRSKLGTYLTGVMIGFILLGMIYYQKHLATQRQQREQEARAAQAGEQPPKPDASQTDTPAPNPSGSQP